MSKVEQADAGAASTGAASTGARRSMGGAMHQCARRQLGPEMGAILGEGNLRAQGKGGRWCSSLAAVTPALALPGAAAWCNKTRAP